MRALPASLAGIGGAILLTATLLVAPASAQPTTVAGLLAYYYDLSAEAELVNEELLVVQEQLAQQQEASAAATKAADEAKAAADTLRAKATVAVDDDRVADALSSGTNLDTLSALASTCASRPCACVAAATALVSASSAAARAAPPLRGPPVR